MLETKLLSRVITDRNFVGLLQYNITEADFKHEAAVYRFIKEFVSEYDQTPSFEVVIKKFKDFNYQEDVYDSFAYLCKEIKKRQARTRVFDILQNQVEDKYQKEDVTQFLDWIDGEIQSIKSITTSGSGLGTNYAVNGSERRRRYEETKESGSDIIIKLPYAGLNDIMDGGPTLTDYLLLQAFTNAGKSWIASHIGVYAWKFGDHGVLHYSPELSKTQQENRNDTVLGHFNNIHLRHGELRNEEEYFKFLGQFKENETPYIIKTMEDLPKGLSIDVIEADLQLNPNIEVVIIDGFNLMQHGKGDRAAMANTSRKLQQLFGKYNVLGIVVHQVSAESEKEKAKAKKDTEGPILPNPAGLLGFSETSAVIQDAAHILSFDAVNGFGQIYVPKTRGTGKEKTIDLKCDFNIGKIEEASPVDHF